MNDFTKEELEEILEGVAWWLDGDSALYSQRLIEKIQSMIDNYQENIPSHALCRECMKIVHE
jgi:hypothetical protein